MNARGKSSKLWWGIVGPVALLSTACNVETSSINATSLNSDQLDRAEWDVTHRDDWVPERQWVREVAEDNTFVSDDEKNQIPSVSPHPVSTSLAEALGKKIAQAVPAHLAGRMDESTFVDFDLGGMFNTRNRDLEGCTQSSFDSSTGLIAVELHCLDLNTATAPDGTVLCETEAVLGTDQNDLLAVDLTCNFSIASLSGELSGRVQSRYTVAPDAMSILVDATFYKPSDNDVYLAASYDIIDALSACNSFDGSARVANEGGAWMNALFDDLGRCNNACEPVSGNIEFTLQPNSASYTIGVDPTGSGQYQFTDNAQGVFDFTPCR